MTAARALILFAALSPATASAEEPASATRADAEMVSGSLLTVGAVAAGVACGVLVARSVGDGLGEHYYYASHQDAADALNAGIGVSCAANLMGTTAGISLLVIGADQKRKARRPTAQLRVSLRGLAATF
jgi:hypothetical protein